MKINIDLGTAIDVGVVLGFILAAIGIALKKPEDATFLVPVYLAIGTLWYHALVLPKIKWGEKEWK